LEKEGFLDKVILYKDDKLISQYKYDKEINYKGKAYMMKAGVKNEVNFFHLDKTCFTLDKRFRLKMATIDNRAYFLDTLKSTLPVRYHTYKALPGNMK
jgi:hypothetical protein